MAREKSYSEQLTEEFEQDWFDELNYSINMLHFWRPAKHIFLKEFSKKYYNFHLSGKKINNNNSSTTLSTTE